MPKRSKSKRTTRIPRVIHRIVSVPMSHWRDVREMDWSPLVEDKDLLEHLKVGGLVKVCNSKERFWIEIITVDKGCSLENPRLWTLHGEVRNDLLFEQPYNCGDIVSFQGRHVYDWREHNENSRVCEPWVQLVALKCKCCP
jgi:hypothetical protein